MRVNVCNDFQHRVFSRSDRQPSQADPSAKPGISGFGAVKPYRNLLLSHFSLSFENLEHKIFWLMAVSNKDKITADYPHVQRRNAKKVEEGAAGLSER